MTGVGLHYKSDVRGVWRGCGASVARMWHEYVADVARVWRGRGAGVALRAWCRRLSPVFIQTHPRYHRTRTDPPTLNIRALPTIIYKTQQINIQ